MSRDIHTSSTSAPFKCSNAVSTSLCPRCHTIDDASIYITTSGAAAAPSAPNPCTASALSNIYASSNTTTNTSASIANACSIPKTI